MKNLNEYYSGKKLHGDDFSYKEIEDWFKDEAEGYAELGAKNHESYKYYYHALNEHHGYRFLPDGPIGKVLGFGSAYGDEFLPVISRMSDITILDPSSAFEQTHVGGVSCRYVKPEVSGILPFANEEFDLVTSLGVLHHIPNVTFVVSEIYRVLKPGGFFILREPIRSMGDWRRSRPGLTRRERGISVRFFSNLFTQEDWVAVNRKLCFFPWYKKLKGGEMFLDPKAVRVDEILCSLFRFCTRYHGSRILYNKYLNMFRPGCVFYVLQKR